MVVALLLWRSVALPVERAMLGLELLSAQDINNRLSPVGEPGADRIVGLFNSLMKRLRDERVRLHEQDTLLRRIMEATPAGLAMLDLAGRIKDANDSFLRIVGCRSAREIEGLRPQQLPDPIGSELASLPVGEKRVVRVSGTVSLRCWHLWFMRDGVRQSFYLVENLAEEMHRAERQTYEKVVRMIAHEVNNTMGSIRTVLDVMAEEASDDMLRLTLVSCAERSRNLSSFIDSVASVVRIPEPDLRPVSLEVEVEAILPFLRIAAGGCAEVVLEPFAAGLRPVRVDAAMLQQALVNIVKNAAESMPVGREGIIVVAARGEGRRVVLEVSNNGVPIDAGISDHLFTPFFSTKSEGRGLGLMLVAEILRRHGCDFTLRTDADGITRFTIFFPLE